MTESLARTLTDDQAQVASAQLRERELSAQSGPPMRDLHPSMTVADAYAIQLGYVERRRAEGELVVGHKVGCTNPALQRQFGIEQPDFGHLLTSMVLDDGAAIARDLLIAPRVEAEIAFVLSRDLVGPGVRAAHVMAATAYLLPCFEIIDSRVTNWDIAIQDTVADNGSSAYAVLGACPRPVDEWDLRSLGVVIELGGEVAGTGAGAAVLGHPAASVAWLANALAEYGQKLSAGDVVLSGALTPAVSVARGVNAYADFGVLGTVRCRFT